MSECVLCPRNCKIDRNSGKTGYCGQTDEIMCARAALHMWEEPCISGAAGSGTVFFSGCSLKCVFCQNHSIALSEAGRLISKERLVEIFFELEEKGANNINLVTPSHFAPVIASCIEQARSEGFRLPFVYNTSSYEKPETIRMFDGLIDVYLPDLKYFDPALSKRYSNAADYFEVAKASIAEMVRQQPECIFEGESGLTGSNAAKTATEDSVCAPEYDLNDPDISESSLIKKGVIVRHLVLPSHADDSKRIIRYLYETYGDRIYMSIMNQFTPVTDLSGYPEIDRRLTEEEYDDVIDFAVDLGVENAFIQEGETANESFIPEFFCEGV